MADTKDAKTVEAAPKPEIPEEAPSDTKAQEKAPETEKAQESKPPQQESPETPPKATPAKTESVQEDKPKRSLFPWKNKRDVTKNPPKTTALTPTEALAKTLDDHISEIKGDDYFVLRIKKRTLLILLGFGVLLMWVFPLTQMALNNTKQSESSNTSTPPPATSPTPAPETLKIRIRYLPTQKELALTIGNLFSTQGFITVEQQEDKQISFPGIVVVTKRDKPDIKSSLESLLKKESLPVASQSAELTQDSDFDATIFVGKTTQ